MRARRFAAAGTIAIALLALMLWVFSDPVEHAGPDSSGSHIPATDPKSIAVLPFENQSDDADNVYFSHGISEEILNLLARIKDRKVTSRTSSFFFADKQLPLRDIAGQLGVRHILEGSVRRAGDRVWVTLQLVDTQFDRQVWSERYDRSVLDMFEVQDEIARSISASLHSVLTGDIGRNPATDSLEAYDHYLRGLHSMRQDLPNESYPRPVEHFKAALSPNNSLNHLGVVWPLQITGRRDEAMEIAQ